MLLSFSWKFWGWDIGENKQRDSLRALWAVNGSLWHALTGHSILALLNQLNGENSKLIAKLLWQFLFTTVVTSRCCYPLYWEPNIPWGRFVYDVLYRVMQITLKLGKGWEGCTQWMWAFELVTWNTQILSKDLSQCDISQCDTKTHHCQCYTKCNSGGAGQWRWLFLIFLSHKMP